MGSSKDDAWREFIAESVVEDMGDTLQQASTKELVGELRKRDGVDAYEVSVEGESCIITWEMDKKIIDTGCEAGSAIILRITD